MKRGFVGDFDAAWAGGASATLRMRTPLHFAGTKLKVYVRGMYDQQTDLQQMALVQGADDQGKITGQPFPILFKGNPDLTLKKGMNEAISDAMTVPITRGTWYLEDRYSSEKFPYAYEVDRGFFETGDAFAKERLAHPLATRTGIAYRVDVFTTDPRTSVVCYGDSITHGYGSTPNSDRRYPSILAKLLDRPVLNLGQNGDLAAQAGGVPGVINELAGAETVIFLMGTNDIILGSRINSAKTYGDVVGQVVDGLHHQKKTIYLGTLPPAQGFKQFDADPEKAKLREEINDWIAHRSRADGVIDFAAALADPANPRKLRADCQTDWLHPNDLGYQKMAEAAARVLRAESKKR